MGTVNIGRFAIRLGRADEGQTSAEYVAVTAIAVVLAVTVAWFAISDGIEAAIDGIGATIVNFITSAV